MMSSVVRFVIAGCVVLAFHTQARGDLVVRITGVPGSGQSTWEFLGSAVAGSGSGFFDDNGNLGNADTWWNIGDFTTVDDFDLLAGSAILSGTATLTINSTTRNITFGYIDHDSGGDDFGVGVDGSGNFSWTAGDTVSWSGTIVTNIDLNDLDQSGLPVTFSTSNYGGGTGSLDLIVKISDATAAPEPSSLLTALVGIGAIGFHRRLRRPATGRRKNRHQPAQKK